jgi:hypothetical protein
MAPGPPAYPPLSSVKIQLLGANSNEAEAKNDHEGRIAPPTLNGLFIAPRSFCQGGARLFSLCD